MIFWNFPLESLAKFVLDFSQGDALLHFHVLINAFDPSQWRASRDLRLPVLLTSLIDICIFYVFIELAHTDIQYEMTRAGQCFKNNLRRDGNSGPKSIR